MQSYNYRFGYTQRHRLLTDDDILLSYVDIRIIHHEYYVHNIIGTRSHGDGGTRAIFSTLAEGWFFC